MINCKNRKKNNLIMKDKIRVLLQDRFTQGLIWNYISIVFLALGGVIFSFLIGYFYDAAVLGYFNKVYAFYIVLSQVMVWGSHMAVTKYVSEYVEDAKQVNAIFSCALLLIVLAFFLISSVAYGGIWCLEHAEIVYIRVDAVNAVVWGTFFFAINKVMLGVLNGMSCMKEYAILQSLRNIFIAVCIIIMAILRCPGEKLVFCFAIAEVFLTLIGGSILFRKKIRFQYSREWLRRIFVFGTHILPANMVLELNTKADILCLSFFFIDDTQLGIYSFAALFAEGFYQLFVVIRRSINPKITQKYARGDLGRYYKQVSLTLTHYGYIIAGFVALLVIGGYNVLCILIGDPSFREGNVILFILLGAILFNQKSIVWGNILSQTGFPLYESATNIITVTANIVGNIVLIHFLGVLGAATATGISYFVYSVGQHYYVRKKIFEES